MNKKEYNEFKKSKEKYKMLVSVLKAVANPTRIFIIKKLIERPHCVFEFSEMTGTHLPAISRHLMVLRSAGIVSYKKHKTKSLYQITNPEVLKFLKYSENILFQNSKNLKMLLKK